MPKKKVSNKKVLTAHDEFVQSMTSTQKRKYEEGYREFLLSELLLELMEYDDISVRELAKAAGVSAAIVQGVRSGERQNITTQSFFKILQALGCSIIIKKDKHVFPMELARS